MAATESISLSSTRTATPAAEKIFTVRSTSASVAVAPGATPLAPQPTASARFGITRVTRAVGNAASTAPVGMPAIMLTTSAPGFTNGA